MPRCSDLLLLLLLVLCLLAALSMVLGSSTPSSTASMSRSEIETEGRARPLRNRPHSSHTSQTKAAWEGGGGVAGLWPYPQMVKSGSTEVPLSPLSFTILTDSSSTVLKAGIDRYATRLLFPFSTSQPVVNKFVLIVLVASDKDDSLGLHTDESYKLSVDDWPSGLLEANTVFGALHGLETFSQLIKWNDTSESYSLPDLPIQITDFPRFPWRGLLIDVSRHFLPLSAIRRTIDAMSYNKLNVLHIHATDAQSIAIQSVTFPNLTKAAWSPKAIYTTAGLKSLVSYALLRGVRIVPEFEMPGHAYGFGVGYPFMVANCPTYTTDINTIPLNVASDDVYDFLLAFLSEMSTIFPDEFIHTGGDEVVVDCWEHDPAIKKWAESKNLTDAFRIFAYFSHRLGTIVQPPDATVDGEPRLVPMAKPRNQALPPYVNRTMVVWQDVFDDNYAHLAHKEMVVEVFRNQGSIRSAIMSGYRALYAYPYYLDQQQPGTDPKAAFYEWVDTWQAFYAADPTTGLNLTASQERMCLGGEGSMWGENVDETNIDSRIWPRASAIAERLWSDRSLTDASAAKPRLINFRCNSLARRSIGAGPIMQDWCPLPWVRS